ncbi:MAG: DotA/TraY family protein [bacterium]|nr:DotA/TraY family protein [bacterium]
MKRIRKPKLNQGVPAEDELMVNPYLARRLRDAFASFRGPRIKAKSTAAFIFLPQFRMCFEGLSHLYPAFIRTMATLFAEVSLIPSTHPALEADGHTKKSYSFRKLVGEAWFRLKTQRATTYQWTMFGAIIMMIVAFTASMGAFFARVFMGVGAVAQAQIFEAFRHPGDPYGKGAGVTELDATAGTITGAAGLFDLRVQGNGISTDYALMALDKMLRQGMASNPTGGALQNALGGLMQIYNSGMLVVACLMIGWMVISVIIDTAKTGTVGGGRHNMVWVPIRVLFALGIMFPLGSAGFSGGQYMVVKLAEWGSNFGTRGWATYVASVVGNQTLLSPYTVANNTNVVTSISKIMVCQVAYNTYLQQRTGALDPDQVIERKQDTMSAAPGTPQQSQLYITNRYSNNTAPNICGAIKYATAANNDDNNQFLDWSTTAPNTAMTASTTTTTAPDNNYKNVGMTTAVRGFRDAMRGALAPVLADTPTGVGAGTVVDEARQFACAFVSRRFSDGGGAGNPVADIPMCAGATAAATDPDASRQQTMLNTMQAAMMAAFTGGGKAALDGYIGTTSASPMMTEMSTRGWAGMAMWYQDIANLNNVKYTAQEPMATVEPGSVWSGSGGAGWERCAGDSNESGEQCKISGLEDKIFTVMNEYDRWWGVSALAGAAGKAAAQASTQANQELNPSVTSSIGSILSWIGNVSIGDNGILTVLTRFIFPREFGVFLFKAVDLSATNTYPLAQLSDTGHSVLGIGALLWTGVSVLQALSTIDGAGFSLGKGLAFSALMGALASVGSMMILAGCVISFYLPALPFIRVAFSVLTWLTSVFEAVVMVPVAALTHLSTQGPGLMGNHGRTAWTLWFNVFLRPILTVFGFVAGMLCYSTFAVFFHTTFEEGAARVMSTNWYPMKILAKVAYSVIYLGTLYAAANTCFKLLDVFPNHLMRWLGEWGAKQDTALLDGRTNIGGGLGFAGASLIKQLEQAVPMSQHWDVKNLIVRDADMGLNSANSVVSRAAALGVNDERLAQTALMRKQEDAALARARMTPEERDQMSKMSTRDKDRFLQHKFLEQENKLFKRFGFEQGHGYAAASTGRKGLKDLGMFGKGHIGGMGFDLGGSREGEGQRGFKDNSGGFRALDGDPSLGRGQLAGASIGDRALDGALAGQTGNAMDMMTPDQFKTARLNVERSLSSTDNINYGRMTEPERLDFVRAYYQTAPELYAPGIGKQGVQQLFSYIQSQDAVQRTAALSGLYPDLYKGPNADAAGRTIGMRATEAAWNEKNAGSDLAAQWGLMTREEKATVAKLYQNDENSRIGGAEAQMSPEERKAYDAEGDGAKRQKFLLAKHAEDMAKKSMIDNIDDVRYMDSWMDLQKRNAKLAAELFGLKG